MDALLIVRMLRKRAILARRDRWSRERLEVHQREALRALRDHAVARSPFYARLHRGLERAPLDALPIVTKRELMDSFDEVVADRRVRLADVRAHLDALAGDELFLGRYRVSATAGSTGLRGIFLADPREWSWIMASFVRANDWAHAGGGLSRNPSHQSARVGLSLASPFVRTLRLDATEDLRAIATALDGFQPQSLVGYASMLRLLAEEQLAGRLAIRPLTVMSASEVLTRESRARIGRAFGVEPFDVYAATETAGIASECDRHRGLHLYEDLVIAELVDERNRPIAPGEVAAKILVTVLFSRTQPLIRYEMSDSVRASRARCTCGRPFALVEAVEGRREDTLILPGRAGDDVRVHPNTIHAILESVPASAWQVEELSDRLLVRVAGAREGWDAGATVRELSEELERRGAVAMPIDVQRVDAIPRTALGKAPLVIARRGRAVGADAIGSR